MSSEEQGILGSDNLYHIDGLVLIPFQPQDKGGLKDLPAKLQQLSYWCNSGLEERNLKESSTSTVASEKTDIAELAQDPTDVKSPVIKIFPSSKKSYFALIPESSVKHPYNRSKLEATCTVILYAVTSLGTQISTSMFGQSTGLIMDKYHVPREVAALPTSFFMFGLSLGPLAFGPISEKYGRKRGILIPYAIASVFTLLAYPVKELSAIIIIRFFAGFFASAPIISSGGALKDMFRDNRRADMLLMYAILVASGPAFGPVLGGAITQGFGSFEYIYLFIGGYMSVAAALSMVCIKESFLPIIEEQECQRLYKSYPGTAFYCKHTCWGRMSLDKYLRRPYKLLWTHLLGWLSLYACFAFGTMYMVVANLPVIVMEAYGWPQGKASAFNLTQFVGILCGTLPNLYSNTRYKKHVQRVKEHGETWRPETRFCTKVLGAFLLPLSFVLLRFGPETHWTVLALSQVCIGCGFFSIFQSSLNYVIDLHGDDSASAVSAITLLRSLAAGILPLCATSLLQHVGLNKYCYIMIGVSVGAAGLPIFMWSNWHKVREKNPYVVKRP